MYILKFCPKPQNKYIYIYIYIYIKKILKPKKTNLTYLILQLLDLYIKKLKYSNLLNDFGMLEGGGSSFMMNIDV